MFCELRSEPKRTPVQPSNLDDTMPHVRSDEKPRCRWLDGAHELGQRGCHWHLRSGAQACRVGRWIARCMKLQKGKNTDQLPQAGQPAELGQRVRRRRRGAVSGRPGRSELEVLPKM